MTMSTVLTDSRVGTTLRGKYRLERLLGVGGTASVYEGVHRNGHRVAVKMLHPLVALNPDVRDRFLREGRVANKVEHPGAACVLDEDTTEDGAVFLVMELLDGDTLESRDVPMPHEEVARLTYLLLDTLAAAHDKGIVHRDIKPENLVVTRDGSLKVLDFGIAQLREAQITGAFSVTRSGSVMGTPAYLPPEQALGRTNTIDGRTDLWATGATMFWLLSGRYVHEAESLEELLVFSGSRSARSITSVVEGVPAALSAVVDRALAFEMADRYPTARAMQDALKAAYPALADISIRAAPPSSRISGVLPNDSSRPDAPLADIGAGEAARAEDDDEKTMPVGSGTRSTSGDVRDAVVSPRFWTRARVVAVAVLVLAFAGGVAWRRHSAPLVPVLAAMPMMPEPAASSEAVGPGERSTPQASVAQDGVALPQARAVGPFVDSPVHIAESAPVEGSAPTRAALPLPLGVSAEEAAPLSTRPAERPAANPPSEPRTPARPPGVAPAPVRRVVPAAPPSPNCDPPYEVDSLGRRFPKAQCL